MPIAAALAAHEEPSFPSCGGLLRKPLRRSMKCALPTCPRTTRDDTARPRRRDLLIYAGGCGGLARYCSETHQTEHWAQHKAFCNRGSG